RWDLRGARQVHAPQNDGPPTGVLEIFALRAELSLREIRPASTAAVGSLLEPHPIHVAASVAAAVVRAVASRGGHPLRDLRILGHPRGIGAERVTARVQSIVAAARRIGEDAAVRRIAPIACLAAARTVAPSEAHTRAVRPARWRIAGRRTAAVA